MNGSFLRREWGAITFVLTVLAGLVVVPLALYFGNQSGAPALTGSAATPAPTLSASPSAPASASPSASATPRASASPTRKP